MHIILTHQFNMLLHVCIFGFVITFLCSPVSAGSHFTEACDAVFSPDAMKMSCCDPMDLLVEVIVRNQNETCSEKFTYSVAQHVLSSFGVLKCDNTTIDEAKVRAVLKELVKQIPDGKPLSDEEERNCLNGQYKQYVTSDPDCEAMKYLVCAYVSCLMGCQKFDDSPCFCKTLSENVTTCKPHLKEYLKQKNSC